MVFVVFFSFFFLLYAECLKLFEFFRFLLLSRDYKKM